MNLVLKSYALVASGSPVSDITEANVVGIKFELVATSVVTIAGPNAPAFTIATNWDIQLPEPTNVKLQVSAATANAKVHLVIKP